VIYCLDLRTHNSPEPYLAEIRRIVAECAITLVSLGAGPLNSPSGRVNGAAPVGLLDGAAPLGLLDGAAPMGSLPSSAPARTAETVPDGFIDLFASSPPNPGPASPADAAPIATSPLPIALSDGGAGPTRIDDAAARRWYPVIDYSRCTNCMECIDFCLFGVYGVDRAQTILVEQPDNCRKGCPACSRVCPANAIMFPQHKTPAIAGSASESAGGLKIDLSQLFGAPNAVEIAAQERDVELVAVGRDAVGLTVGIPKRQAGKESGPKDDLDALMDQLDGF
jgi:NAD-dependent dihydropyrimidine dehydrogenase PreA subunit